MSPGTMAWTLPEARPAVIAHQPRRRSTADVALLLSTYEKPYHLQRVLLSIALQQGVDNRMELVVTDDGSTDDTAKVVERFARTVPFPVTLTTHPHEAFQLARCRNEGVAASTAPYLLFLDGDCLLPPDHVAQHLRHREQGEVMGGYCVRLDKPTSERIDEAVIRSQEYMNWIEPRALAELKRRDWKARFYRLLRHPTRPKLAGGNIGIWRDDYLRVNGFDENFVGWGGEDDDLCRRLRRTGVKIGSILRWTHTVHLWHPSDPSAPRKIREGLNFGYLGRSGHLTRCRRGLVKRPIEDLRLRIVGQAADTQVANHLLLDLPATVPESGAAAKSEVEILFHPGTGSFSGEADCNVLVQTSTAPPPRRLLSKANLVVGSAPPPLRRDQQFSPLADWPAGIAALG